jgi:hypothetical protein
VLIILTGNYNFFNLLTLALCIPVLGRDFAEDDDDDDHHHHDDDDGGLLRHDKATSLDPVSLNTAAGSAGEGEPSVAITNAEIITT